MDHFVKLALIQMDCEFGEVEKNVFHAVCMVRDAAKQGAKLICLPECFNVGYSVNRVQEMQDFAETMNGWTISHMRTLAKELEIYLVVPIVLSVCADVAQNAVVFIDDSGCVIGVYAKKHLIGGEKDHFKRGNDYPVFDTKYGKIGILICYDLSHPEAARILAENGAQLIIVPCAWRDKRYFMHGFNINMQCRAIDNILFVAGANRCGVIDGVSFGGCSQIVDPEGVVIAKGDTYEAVIVAEINLDRVREERLTNSVLIDSCPEDFVYLAEKYHR